MRFHCSPAISDKSNVSNYAALCMLGGGGERAGDAEGAASVQRESCCT